jgi:hypothetical protein
MFTPKVFNKGNIRFGGGGLAPRQARVRVSLPAQDGSLQSTSGAWVSSVDLLVPAIDANSPVVMTQVLHIALNARPYKHIKVNLALYISAAGSNAAAGWDIERMRFIQSLDIEMQVAPGHVFKERSDILVVTNANTQREQFEAIQGFIKDDLSLTMDIWNVNLYGGLFQVDEDEDGERVSILSLYQGKTIIFLGNKFEFYGAQSTSILDFCDAESLFEACVAGTSCLFLGAANDQKKFKEILFPVSQKISDHLPLLTATSCFEDASQLVRAVSEQKSADERSHQLGVQKCWYRTTASTLSHAAKRMNNALQDRLPQERFWICPVESIGPNKPGLVGNVLVYRGLPRSAFIAATESSLFANAPQQSSLQLPGTLRRAPTRTGRRRKKLDSYDQYSIVGALPISKRIDILWSAGTEMEAGTIGEDLMLLIALSTQEELVGEIRSFLSRCSWPNKIDLNTRVRQSLLTHLPSITALLEHPAAKSSEPAPPQIFHLLYFALAACEPQKKCQVAKQILLPFGHRGNHLRQALVARFEEMLKRKGTQPNALAQFHKQAASLHSSFSTAKRNTSALLAQDVSTATGKSTHFLTSGRVSMRDVYPRTRLWTEGEWNNQLTLTKTHEEELTQYMQRAWEEKEKLLLDEEGEIESAIISSSELS